MNRDDRISLQKPMVILSPHQYALYSEMQKEEERNRNLVANCKWDGKPIAK